MARHENSISHTQVAQTAAPFIGKQVSVDLSDKKRPVIGKLKSIDETGLIIETDSGKTEVPYAKFSRILLAETPDLKSARMSGPKDAAPRNKP